MEIFTALIKQLAALKMSPLEIGYNPTTLDGDDALAKVLTLVYMWAAIVAVIVLVIAGYFFVTSRGDPAQMKRSKDAIRGAVVGLVIIIAAFAITQFVIGGIQE
jgi:hypothetical protein